MFSLQNRDLEEIAKGAREYIAGSPEQFAYMLMVLLGVLVVGLVLSLVFSGKTGVARHLKRLFRDFSASHGLTGAERRMLWRAARRAALEDPVMIFFRRSVFEGAAGDLGLSIEEVEALRQKIYGP